MSDWVDITNKKEDEWVDITNAPAKSKLETAFAPEIAAAKDIAGIAKGVGTAITSPIQTAKTIADQATASDIAFRNMVGLPQAQFKDPQRQAELEAMSKDTLPAKIEAGIRDPLSVPGKVIDYAMEKPVSAALTGMGLSEGVKNVVFKPKTAYQITREIDSIIAKGVAKGIRPSVQGKGSFPLIKSYNEKARNAVETIIDNKNNLKFVRDGEDVVGVLPTSVTELSDAISQTKRSLWKNIDDMAKKSGQNTYKNLNVDTVADELEAIANNKNIRTVNEGMANYAAEMAKKIRQNSLVSPEDVQEQLTHLNNKLNSYYSKPTADVTEASVDALVGNMYRKMLDDHIETVVGPGYQKLRNQYTALKAMEKDVAHRAVVDARKNVKGLIDFTDIASASDLARAVVKLDPSYLASATAMQVIKNTYKSLNDPNRIISKMFSDVAKKKGYVSPNRINPAVMPSMALMGSLNQNQQ